MLTGRKRIMVIGSGGAGKSTFARELAARTGLPLIHLDRHYWKPGWIPTPNEEWDQRVRELSCGDAWIIDGNYSRTLSIRVSRCDAIVFFDIHRAICLWGILERWLFSRFKSRPDLPDGCREQFSLEFVRWVWNYPRRSRPGIQTAIRQVGPDVQVFTVTQRRQVRKILA